MCEWSCIFVLICSHTLSCGLPNVLFVLALLQYKPIIANGATSYVICCGYLSGSYTGRFIMDGCNILIHPRVSNFPAIIDYYSLLISLLSSCNVSNRSLDEKRVRMLRLLLIKHFNFIL